MTEDIEKSLFRIGYQATTVPLMDFAIPGISHERRKFVENCMFRDIYIFLRQFDHAVFDEYTKAIEGGYVNSTLSSEDLDSTLVRVLGGRPHLIHTYFLSKVAHFFFFSLRHDLRRVAPAILDSFSRVISLHQSSYRWPYAPELRDAFYSLHEFMSYRHWPLGMLIRHFYICLAELHQLTREDFSLSVGENKDAFSSTLYDGLMPFECIELLGAPGQQLNEVVFDDTYAFYAYLKANHPDLISRDKSRIEGRSGGRSDDTNGVSPEKAYRSLSNLVKLRYVKLANSITEEEMLFVQVEIAPFFEMNDIFKRGFVEAHDSYDEW